MDGVTRRKCLAMGGVPLVAAIGAYAVEKRNVWPGSAEPRFQPAQAPRALIQERHLPNLPLVTHKGERVRFYEDLVKDKKVVLSFVSSLAPGESAKVTHNLGALQRLFGNRVGSDIFMYSISRTPDRDSPAVLKRWAARSGAGRGWKFLTGDPADLETLRHSLGFASPDHAEDADPAYAIGFVRYGVEPEMRWAHCQSQAPARVLAHSMLLDFGAGPPIDSPIAWRFRSQGGQTQAPIWNCRLLLRGVD